MSKNQVKSIALSALKASATVLLFLSKAIVYLCIAIAVVGQLLFQEYASAEVVVPEVVEEFPEVVVPIVDPWEEVVQVPAMAKTIARPAVLAVELPESIALDVDADRYQGMTSPQLRKECSKAGIQWRSVYGKSKHLSKAEMLAALG
jgi:hypothetical protein